MREGSETEGKGVQTGIMFSASILRRLRRNVFVKDYGSTPETADQEKVDLTGGGLR